jgi:hypothetical protein
MDTLTESPYKTPEDYAAHMQAVNDDIKQAVEAAKQARINERSRKAQEARIIESMDRESKRRKDAEFIERQTAGMSPHQKKIYERLMQLGPLIESSAGDKKLDYQSEYSVLLSELVKGGRYVGEVSFVQEPILISTSGHGLIFQGKYHQGTIGSFDTTTWLLKQDSETKELYLGRMGVVEHTNILIEDRLAINILDELPKPVPKHSPDLFPKPQALAEPRPDTKQQAEKKKKRFF